MDKKPNMEEEKKLNNEESLTDIEDYDDVLDRIGTFGFWQRVIYALISAADIFGAFAMLLPVFVSATPNWTCSRYGPNIYVTHTQNGSYILHNNSSTNQTAITPQMCSYQNLQCSEIEFHDDFTSIVSEWNLVCGNSFAGDLITSIQMVGLLCGAGLMGQISDTVGRKKGFYIAYFIMIISGLGSAFASSWQTYAAARVVVGFGFGGYMVIYCIYPMEFIGRKWRAFTGTIGVWAIGTILLAPLAYLIRDWRHLAIATSAGGLLYLATIFIVPESPRWLLQHDRIKEAEKVTAVIAKRNGKPMLDSAVFQRLGSLNKKSEMKNHKYTYIDLFRSRKYAIRASVMFLSWFTVFILYYGGSFNMKHLSGDRYLNVLIGGFVDWAAMISVIFIINIIGRRHGLWLYLSIGMVSLLSILFIIIANKQASLSILVVIFALLGKSAGLSGTYCSQILTAELFPTVVRNIAVGFGSIAARIGCILAPQIVYLGTLNKSAPYIICVSLCALVIPLLLLVPETNGKPLDDVFDQDHHHTLPKEASHKHVSNTV